jgi:O-antigen/teichoic acid export membrane protein
LRLVSSIYQHIKFYSLANFLGKGANVVIFLVIAKVFSVQEFADYITLMIVTELALVILIFGVDSYIMRSKTSSSFEVTLEFIKFNLLINFIFFISIIVLYLVNFLAFYYFLLFLSINTYLFYRIIEKLFLNYLIRSQKSADFMKITFITSYTQLLLILIAYYFNFLNITSYFFLLSTAILILISFLFINLTKEKLTSSDVAIFKLNTVIISSYIKAAFPFLGKNIIGSINLYSSRVLLAGFAAPVELAAYGFYLALYFKAIGLMSVVSKTFIPMMKDRVAKINKLHVLIRKYELLYLFFVLIFSFSLFIAYNNLIFIQDLLATLIKKEYLEMLDIGFIFILCFFCSMPVMIYDFWQYSLQDVSKKIITLSVVYLILSVTGYAAILQLYGVTEIALYYLGINLLMLFVSRRYFYQIKASSESLTS